MSTTENEQHDPAASPSWRELLAEKEFWLLLACCLLLFSRPLFGGQTFFFRDLYLHFFPQRALVAQLLRSSEIPLWDPLIHGGEPLLANMNNAALYPTVILYLLLPPLTAFNLEIILHVAVAALGAYLLARRVGLSPAGALVSGGVYAFCGLQLSLPNVWLFAGAHLPLILLCWHLFLSGKGRLWLLLAVACGVLQVLAGRPEWPPLTWLFLAGWSLCFPYPVSRARRVALCACAAGFVLAISLVQVLPMLEMLQQSARTRGADAEAFVAWSVSPWRLPELVLPHFFGDTGGATGQTYWGSVHEDLGFPYMLSIYFGFPALLLAGAGGLLREGGALPARVRRYLLGLAAAALLLSLGNHLPGFAGLVHVPLIGVFRYPSKLLIAGMLPAALLAGTALELDWMRTRGARLVLLPLAPVALLLAAVRVAPSLARAVCEWWFRGSGPVAVQGVTTSLLHAAIALLAMLMILFAARRRQGFLRHGLAVVVLVDVVIAGWGVNMYAPAMLLRDAPPLASWLQARSGGSRFYRQPTPGRVTVLVDGPERYRVDRWHIATLDTYMAARYGIPVVYHEDLDRLAPGRTQRLADSLGRLPWNSRLPILSAGAVKYFLAFEPVTAPGAALVARIQNSSDSPLFLYENTRAVPSVYFCGGARIVASDAELLAAVSDPTFDPRAEVLLSEGRAAAPASPAAGVRVISQSAIGGEYEVTAPAPGHVVFADSFYPGWHYRVDGREVSAVPANYAFTAIEVGAGSHRVERSYRPRSVLFGAVASAASALLLLLCSRKLSAFPAA